MNRSSRQLVIEESFTKIAKALDITVTRYQEAVERYEALGEWLGRDESSVKDYSPQIYPQGSFLLGTVIKPISDEEDYDIDLVCQVDLSKGSISQKHLKKLIGDEIKKYVQAKGIKKCAQEGKRCWTIEYADGAQFHMDILPAVPNVNVKGSVFPETEISITDNSLPNFSEIDSEWPQSNPKGFAQWFKKQMEVQFHKRMAKLAEASGVTIDEVPEFSVRTPLQIAVQLLKRHRDIVFVGKNTKPISIIITTLAARAYNGEESVSDALKNIVERMERFFINVNGRRVLKNPINENEFFTDRWTDKDEDEFFAWLEAAKETFVFSPTDLNENESVVMERAFGEKIAKRVLRDRELNSCGTERPSPPNIAINRPARPWRKQ